MKHGQKMNMRSLGGVLVVVSANLAACGAAGTGTRTCTGGDCDLTQQTACTRDSECNAEQFCDGGLCAPRDTVRPDDACSAHQDCTMGQFCNIVTGHCVECLNEDHCDVGLVCRADGTCGENTGCTTDGECGGRVCETATGQCVQCTSSANCPDGQTCRNQQCFTEGNADPVCEAQADCDAYGRVCDGTGHCVMCTDSSQCADGKTCSNGQCSSGTTGGDGTCQTSTDCGGQACFINYCMPCFSDFMCVSLDDLMAGVTKICDTQAGNCIAPQCETAQNCTAGQACYGSGHCGSCEADEECRTGEVCDVNTGICGQPPPCTGNASCTNGKVCVSSACVACTSTPQCDAGKNCVNGACVTPQAECTTNAQCTNGKACISGVCAPCTVTTQCDSDKVCISGACAVNTTPGPFGAECASHADCAGNDAMCLRWGSKGHCTRLCVGNGKGGLDDCPMGWGCYDFNSDALDGIKLCAKAEDVHANDASYPGYPFEQGPGDVCTSSNNQCQTSWCFSDVNMCALGCLANRDCPTDEVCFSHMTATGVFYDRQLCLPSNLDSFKAEGAACNNAIECDSGLCVGTCSDGKKCNANSDCTSGTCTGTCRDHCRNNADCKAEQACWPWPLHPGTDDSGWVPTCQPKLFAGTKALGAACSAYSECASDWCSAGFCTTPCATTDDCVGPLAGKVCAPVSIYSNPQTVLYSVGLCR